MKCTCMRITRRFKIIIIDAAKQSQTKNAYPYDCVLRKMSIYSRVGVKCVNSMRRGDFFPFCYYEALPKRKDRSRENFKSSQKKKKTFYENTVTFSGQSLTQPQSQEQL